MRILFWTEVFWPNIGGIEVMTSQLIPALQERGHEFVVVASNSKQELPAVSSYQGIPIHRFHFEPALASRDLRRIKETQDAVAALKKSFRPDVVHTNSCGPSLFFHLHTVPACSVPTLHTVHSLPPVAFGPNSLQARALRAATWVSAISEAMLADMRALVPEITPHSSVLHGSLPVGPGAPVPLPFEPPTILCLGRLHEEKGFDLVLNALPEIRTHVPAARVLVAGDGPARVALEEQASSLGIEDAVEFLGWVHPAEVESVINRATLVAVPSRVRDAFPISALQSAQLGRPIVAARVGGLPELVEDGLTGCLVEKGNDVALAKAITGLLAHQEKAEAMGVAARQRTLERFGWAAYVDACEQLYRRIDRKDHP